MEGVYTYIHIYRLYYVIQYNINANTNNTNLSHCII